jgi:hypothetical protein
MQIKYGRIRAHETPFLQIFIKRVAMKKKMPKRPLPLSKDMVPFCDRSEWEQTIEKIENTFFFGDASYEWQHQFYLLDEKLSFPPKLFYLLFEKTFELTSLKSVQDPLRIGLLWVDRKIETVADCEKYSTGKIVATSLLSLFSNRYKMNILPYSENEEKVITMCQDFGYGVPQIEYAIMTAKSENKKTVADVFVIAEEWFLEGCKTLDDIHTYKKNKPLILAKRAKKNKIIQLPFIGWDKTKY